MRIAGSKNVLLPLAVLVLGTFAAAAEGETPLLVQGGEGGGAKAPPKPPPAGVMSVIIGKPPPVGETGGLPLGLSETSMTSLMAAMVVQRENTSLEDAGAGRKAAAKATKTVESLQAEMAKQKVFTKLPSALSPQLSGRAGAPCHYFLYVPESYKGKRKYPLLLFLHGAGGNLKLAFYTVMRCARKQKIIVACPTYKDGQWWTKEGTGFAMKVLADVEKRYQVDPKRVAIGGISNGAIGAWAISEKHKKKFAAVMSISGAFNGRRPVEPSKGPPLYITHGGRDGVIPATLSRAAFKALKGRKGTVYKELPDEGHLAALFKPEKTVGAALEWFRKLTAGGDGVTESKKETKPDPKQAAPGTPTG